METDHPIFEAIQQGNIQQVAEYLDNGLPVETADRHNWTLLSHAAYHEATDILKLLLKRGAKVDAPSVGSRTPLMIASAQVFGDRNVHALLSARANVNARSADGMTPLLYAVTEQAGNNVEILLGAGAEINAQNHEGNTALIIATKTRSIDVIKKLLDYGADVNIKNKKGRTALIEAGFTGEARIVKAIMAKHPSLIQNNDLDHALMTSARLGKKQKSLILLKAGANLSATTESGDTPLLMAGQHGRVKVVHLLLKEGADFRVKNKSRGQSALLFAAQFGDEETIKFLLKKGVDIKTADFGGNAALSYAAWAGQLSAIKLLLENGADIMVKNKEGETPLVLAKKETNRKKGVSYAETIEYLAQAEQFRQLESTVNDKSYFSKKLKL